MPTANFLENRISDNAADPFLALLTLFHDDLPTPIRLVRDYQDLVSRGQSFSAFPFDFTFPGSGEDGQAPARIQIDNLDRRIVDTVRVLSTPPRVLIEIVAASAPDVVEESLPIMKLGAVDAGRLAVQAELVDVDEYSEPAMRWMFTPSIAPALFQ